MSNEHETPAATVVPESEQATGTASMATIPIR